MITPFSHPAGSWPLPCPSSSCPSPAEGPVNCKPELQPLILARPAHCLVGQGSHHSISALNNILGKYLALKIFLGKHAELNWAYIGQTRTRPINSTTFCLHNPWSVYVVATFDLSAPNLARLETDHWLSDREKMILRRGSPLRRNCRSRCTLPCAGSCATGRRDESRRGLRARQDGSRSAAPNVRKHIFSSRPSGLPPYASMGPDGTRPNISRSGPGNTW